MARRAPQEQEFNFDSLMEVVTNLAGGLILLVVLMLAFTWPMAHGVKEASVTARKVGGAKPMDPLLETARSMQEQLASVAQDLNGMTTQLKDLETEIATLGTNNSPP